MKILVLPGLDGMARLRMDLRTWLPSEFAPIIIEYPVDLVRYADLFNWIEEQLPAENYVIVAESFSGPLAVYLAAERPSKLKGLVFVATFANAPRQLPSSLLGLLNLLPLRHKVLSVFAQPFLMGKWRSFEFADLFHEIVKLLPVETIRGRIVESLSVDCAAKLETIEVPYIYLGASHDRLVPRLSADEFRHGAQSVSLIDGPHFLLQANPKDAAEHVVAFLESLD